jgi:cbb3-type cytochrome oxidase subunit 1
VLFLVGILIMTYNVFKTIGSGESIKAQPVPQSA